MGRSRQALLAATTVLLSSTLALALAEGMLRLRRPPAARDAPVLDYPDTWRDGGLGPGGYLKEGFEGLVTDGLGGKVRWKNNVGGFRRDEETAETPQTGVVRILSLGDSFTAGYRVDQEATFSRLLERQLRARGTKAEVLISCIEEPVTGLFYLDRHGRRLRPAVVLVGITLGNDIAQAYAALDDGGAYRLGVSNEVVEIAERHEEERETGDRYASLELPGYSVTNAEVPPERLAPRRSLRLLDLLLGPPAAPISSTYGPHRLLDSNGLGMFLAHPPAVVNDAYDALFRALEGYRLVCRSIGARLAVLLFPQRYQVRREDWVATRDAFGLREACFDLRAPNRRISGFCRRTGILCCDPTEALAARIERTGERLYLPLGDIHWNAAGHRMVFESLSDELVRVAEGR